MFQPEPSIPPDLWSRLASLDLHCDVRLFRVAQGGASDRVWRVSITSRGRTERSEISIDAPALVDALRFALLEAERCGWHLGRPGGLDPAPPHDQSPARHPTDTDPAAARSPQNARNDSLFC